MSGKNTSVVDANVIVSLLLADARAHFERARAFFEPVREGGETAYIPSAVIAECIYVLTRVYGVKREDAATKLLGLLDYRGVTTESPAVRRALALFRDRKIDFVDALVASAAHEHGWRVFSFDRGLEKLAK